MNVSFPVILLFWALSLSPVWLNIEGQQDFSYKTQILFFCSENNSNSLNRPLNTNLIVVHCCLNLEQILGRIQTFNYFLPIIDEKLHGFTLKRESLSA